MCRIVYVVEGRGALLGRPTTVNETYNMGDVVTVEDDGTFLGREVEPATATGGNVSVIEVPGVSADQMRYLMRTHLGTDPLTGFAERVLKSRPGHDDGDVLEQDVIRKREYGIDRQLLSANHQANWRNGRGISSTQATIEAAIRDHTKAGSPPVDPTTIPRRGSPR